MINMKASKILNSKTKGDKEISIALMASFVILTIQYFVLVYFNLLGDNTATRVQLTSKVVIGITFLYAFPEVLRRSKRKFIVVYFIAIFVFLIHYLIFPDNHQYLKDLVFPLFFMSLPAFVYSITINDWDLLKQVMKKSSLVIFLFGTILGILVFSGQASVGAYSMSLSYYMLLPAIMFLDELLNKFSPRLLVYTVISLIVILALGSRGAFLCIIGFVFLKFVRPNSNQNKQRIIGCIGIIGVAFLGYMFFERILEFFNSIFLNLGIKSRSISLFLEDKTYLSGRDYIYQTILAKIAENPILGLGLGGDRRILEGVVAYPHNIIIELLANYGVVIGGIIISILIILIVKNLISKVPKKYNMVCIWFSLGFIHFMVSSSYLIDLKFWIFLGILVNGVLRESQYNNQYS